MVFASGCFAGPIARADEGLGPLSIYEVKPFKDGLILGAAAFLDLYPILNDFHFVYLRPEARADEVIPLDRHVIGNHNVFADHLSDVTIALSLAAPALVDYLDVGWTHVFFEDIFVYAQTLAINSALTGIFKYTTQRPIPRVYEGDPSFKNSPRGYEDFYSGHVSTATAALSVLAITLDLRHDAGAWPWAVMGVVGTSVAAERVAAGKHFYTAVIVGGVMGTAVGVLVPWLHKRELEGKPTLGLAPANGGAELTWTRHF